ncbi:MAG: DNA polymerase III subunit beta [Alkalimonas sp.]|uniref:Beta sliding clamp n=1 Tax=Alkalimonas delamerensis TaxID=265981 RepID=A0ABT9GT96_9GAMM|nr:DNA polymerase III subunit beta [Alkalimonas delamerensis]MCC5852047.1 DNA polymerase III subunit beta [Alkalimonas sp.]MDP4530197.1 DNA polymerase III subunit beta [Alkalimonas delamerensis]
MHLSIDKETLLKPLQMVSGAIERRHTLPILSNVLLDVQQQQLSLTGTDLEIEMVASVAVSQVHQPGRITVPAKKLLDICRSLPDGCQIELTLVGEHFVISSGKAKFTLTTLPATEYPNLESWQGEVNLQLSRAELRRLLEETAFSMANQDVRYYLNGLLFEVDQQLVRTVATDGHRLAMSQLQLNEATQAQQQLIIPRKGVLEMLRLLPDDDGSLTLSLGANHIRLVDAAFSFSSKLIDGRFPDYRRVIPRNSTKQVTAHRPVLKDACTRASILSNEKYRGVRFNLAANELQITANNPEHEQAEEVIEVEYQGDTLEIGFNVGYVLDVLNSLNTDLVLLHLSDSNSSVLIEGVGNAQASYVVMPMRL